MAAMPVRPEPEIAPMMAQLTAADLALHAAHAEQPRLDIAITGASGLLGQQLVALLRTGGHRVRRLVRGPARADDEVSWDPARGEIDGFLMDYPCAAYFLEELGVVLEVFVMVSLRQDRADDIAAEVGRRPTGAGQAAPDLATHEGDGAKDLAHP
mgnify:CR=1 FL=1